MEGNERKMNGNERKMNGKWKEMKRKWMEMKGKRMEMEGIWKEIKRKWEEMKGKWITDVLSIDVLSMNLWCSKYRGSKCHLEHLYPCKFRNIFSKRCSKCLSVNIYTFICYVYIYIFIWCIYIYIYLWWYMWLQLTNLIWDMISGSVCKKIGWILSNAIFAWGKPWENHDEHLPKSCFLLGLYVIPSVHQTQQLTITTENGHHCSPLYPFRGDFPSHGFHSRKKKKTV